jgi:outer membrane protein assembly factor BamB
VTTAIEGAEFPGWKAPLHLASPEARYVNPAARRRMLTLKVYALQATTGKILWERTSFEGPPYDDRHRSNTYASSTIATDGKLLYVSFEAAGFYAYDIAGALKWKLDLGNIAKGGLGPGTSPSFTDLVILQCDQEMGEGRSSPRSTRRRARRHGA